MPGIDIFPFMDVALDAARQAAEHGEVPVGAVVVDARGGILAVGRNQTIARKDPTAHAEMLAIREACAKLGSERLVDCDLHVTLEPCAMCATAISFARIRRVYFGAEDERMGGVEHGAQIFTQPTCHHRPEVYGGIGARAAADLLRAFFQQRRS